MIPEIGPQRNDLHGLPVFISASIPDKRWKGEAFDPLEITEATLAAARAVMSADGHIIFGGHPTISPLILRVAEGFSGGAPADRRLVKVYQSALYADLIPEPTLAIAERGIGEIEIVPAVEGESPEYGKNLGSLEAMRARMFDPERNGGQRPLGALFIGGMEGIRAEHRLFAARFPEAPVFALGAPGGAAAELARDLAAPDGQPGALATASSRDYGSLMDDIVASLAERI